MPLGKNASSGTYVDDFVHSKNKRFKGKSKKERIRMALGAYYSKKNESVSPKVVSIANDNKKPGSIMTKVAPKPFKMNAANDNKAEGLSDLAMHGIQSLVG